MSFQQLPIQVGTERGLLRVLNTGRAQLPVRRVGLDWAGYGDAFLIAEDNVLAPGQTVDFPVALPAPNCSHVSGPVVGVVDAGTATVRTPLDGPGSVLLRRNRRIACGEKLVQHRLAIEYGRSWRLTGAGAGTAMAGHLRLTRRTGSEEIRLVRAEGSVLYGLELPGPSVLPADASSLVVPLLVRPGNRCDEHAHSQASAPFAFRLIVKIGEERADVDLTPPPAVQAKAPALLRRACR